MLVLVYTHDWAVCKTLETGETLVSFDLSVKTNKNPPAASLNSLVNSF